MNKFEQVAIDNGWIEEGIGFLIHPKTDDDIFLDFNGHDENTECFIVYKSGCNEAWDVVFTYDELARKYIK